jgi:DNA polymerase III epsilon subunit-like protein
VIAADRLWIMIDVETSGPILGTHSMTELGAVVGSKARGVIDRFEALIAPISEHVTTSQDSFARAAVSGLPPREAMARFAAWCKPYQEQRATFILRAGMKTRQIVLRAEFSSCAREYIF